ncbi:hypothetical protein E1B28_005096 [Marasmius oreades]|uniref:Uncharacterized protein n=1 Tax=Marasmius oreades TaxID=181124 RepID=A0A9P7V026_9AGAR|nr:uncharacterized protein E1B28_005096 [Marasmius oreades]KAG7097777.1 hypothetical protein E1B28_005096 [Marasmius oreades]
MSQQASGSTGPPAEDDDDRSGRAPYQLRKGDYPADAKSTKSLFEVHIMVLMRFKSFALVMQHPTPQQKAEMERSFQKVQQFLNNKTQAFNAVHSDLDKYMEDLHSDLQKANHRGDELKKVDDIAIRLVCLCMATMGLTSFTPDLWGTPNSEWNEGLIRIAIKTFQIAIKSGGYTGFFAVKTYYDNDAWLEAFYNHWVFFYIQRKLGKKRRNALKNAGFGSELQSIVGHAQCVSEDVEVAPGVFEVCIKPERNPRVTELVLWIDNDFKDPDLPKHEAPAMRESGRRRGPIKPWERRRIFPVRPAATEFVFPDAGNCPVDYFEPAFFNSLGAGVRATWSASKPYAALPKDIPIKEILATTKPHHVDWQNQHFEFRSLREDVAGASKSRDGSSLRRGHTCIRSQCAGLFIIDGSTSFDYIGPKKRHRIEAEAPAPPPATTRVKFKEVEADIMPQCLAPWKQASDRVGEHFNPNAYRNLLGYFLPDPQMIAVCGLESGNYSTRTAYITVWLKLRHVLCYHLRTSCVTPLGPSHWRTVLGIEKMAFKQKKAAKQKTEVEEILKNSGNTRSVDLDRLDTAKVEWNGTPIDVATAAPATLKEILWELFEIGFRYELLMVDRQFYGGSKPREEREPELLVPLMRHWKGSFIPADFREGKTGFASADLLECRMAIFGFLLVMDEWKDAGKLPPSLQLGSTIRKRIDMNVTVTSKTTTREVDKIEYTVARHYISCFATTFGRAPTLPHRLS